MEKSMRVLLMAMPDVSCFFLGEAWHAPSVGLTMLAGNLDPHHQVYIADLVRRRGNVRGAVKKLLSQYGPDLVGLSAMTFQYGTAKAIAQLIRKYSPRTSIAIGGYHSTLMYREIADEDGHLFDYIFRGEAEASFNLLLRFLEGSGDLRGILGLSFLHDGEFIHNPPAPILNLEDLRLPAREKRVYKGFHLLFHQFDVMETSRGCTMKCNFCCMRKMYGETFRLFPFSWVMEDLDRIVRKGCTQVFLTDDNILMDLDRFEEFLDRIVSKRYRKLNITFQASSVGITRRPELVRKMYEAGVCTVFLGIENVSRANLKALNKGDILDHTKEAIRLLHENNIMIIGGMILGLPADGVEDIRENFEFFYEQDIQEMFDQILTPYPKTEIRDELLEQGLVTNPTDFRHYNGYWANVRTRKLSEEELLFSRWQIKREVKKLWKPSRTFIHHFPHYARLWKYFLRPLIFLNELILTFFWGNEGRYRQQMKNFEKMNAFNVFDDRPLFSFSRKDPIVYLEGIIDRAVRAIKMREGFSKRD
jgi:anaerobic magnesium-protoporphyrin IX monomethyl ester cyclase